VDARSALFDLYGDHLRFRGGQAPVAALVRLLAPLDIAPPAVRTAVSRMVRQGWLEPTRVGRAPGYALSGRARRRLDASAARIYRTDPSPWDGSWHVLVLSAPLRAARRERLDRALRFLGYAPLGDRAWVALRRSGEVDSVLAAEGARAEAFAAAHDGDSSGLARRAWDLDALARSYLRWARDADELLRRLPADAGDAERFAARSRLVHEWRKFLFSDPGLPPELLPDPWPGDAAAALFDREAQRLSPAAARFVDRCLDLSPSTPAADVRGARP
jgi:phenylacetic acid degradation operon negative regulatory protein